LLEFHSRDAGTKGHRPWCQEIAGDETANFTYTYDGGEVAEWLKAAVC
jgi:hypothetical protein